MKIVVTIPAYNEEKTIGKVLKDIHRVMKENKDNYKILVVDDGSTDKTVEIAKKNAIVYSHPKNYGLAATFNTEMKKCLELGADIIVHIDADGQYLTTDIPKLIKKINQGYDLVLGSRFKGRIEYMSLIKRLGNKAFSRVISGIVKYRISDTQTGLRAFTKDVARIELSSTYTYTQEQVIRAIKEKFRVTEVPVYFARRKGKSRLMKGPLSYAARAWINILRIYRDYEPLRFFGIIGGLFFLIGFVIGMWLLYLFITTGKIGHIPATILSMLFLLVGMQIILFGFLADMNRK